jgi:glycosyltransferase involved in cell wall biosynthesis
MKKISIVIPTFNEEKLLPILLESIKKQKGVKVELIVSDNSSTDNTRKIASSYGAKIVEGGLPAKSRNNGAKAASNDIILFLDADVVLPSPDFLKRTLFEFNKNNFGIATCEFYPISEKTIDKLFHQAANFYLKKTHSLMPHVPGFCIFVKKIIHEKINGFDEALKLAEDHDYAQRASKIAKFGFLKSYPILVSVRRFERDGRFNIVAKYALCEAHILFKGPVKSDIFKYTFGYPNKKIKKPLLLMLLYSLFHL